MRWIRDILLLLIIGAIGAGVVWWQMQSRDRAAEIDKTTAETQRLEREIRFRAATKSATLNSRGWPTTVDPKWFETQPPCNVLVDEEKVADRPWVEIASEDDAGLTHPAIRMTLNEKMAGFWYNPYLGIVRARVPVEVSDQAATTMYNAVNQVSIASIHWVETVVDTAKLIPNTPEQEAAKKAAEEKAAAEAKARQHPLVVVRHGTTPAKKP